MRAVVYVRNSSGKQVQAGTHEGLLSSGRETAARLGADVVAVYADKGVSAKSGNLHARGDFARLVADLPALKPDICIVANVDRLTRTELFRELGGIWGPLQEAGVRVATAGGQILDLATPEGQLMAMFESWRSARENAARRERSKTGRKRAAREGRNPGRPPYGYRHVEGTWQAPGAAIVRELYERSAAGESCGSLAGLLNRRGIPSVFRWGWSSSTIVGMIRPRRPNGDPYVTGLWIGQPGESAIQVPAIVSADLAERARAALGGRANSPPRKRRHVQLLDEHAARCGLCGGWIRVVASRGRVRADGTRTRFAYYGCERRVKAVATGEPPCTLPLRRVEVADAAVWSAVLAWAEGGAVIEGATAAAGRREQAAVDLEGARRQLAGEQARLEALAEALGSGALTADSYRVQVERVVARRDLAAQQVATWEARARAPSSPTAGARAEIRLAFRAAAVAADPAARRSLVRRLFPAWILDATGIEAVRVGDAFGEPMPSPARILLAA